jgi:hypothetical protein
MPGDWQELGDLGTWVVFNESTGESREDMRFATKREARDWINSRIFPWEFGMRYEP